MRQAGRYMAEYRAVRKHHSLLEICKKPELAAEVTITAAERLKVDAAIIFADLLLPLEVMGLPFHFAAGEGPVIEKPVREPIDLIRRLDQHCRIRRIAPRKQHQRRVKPILERVSSRNRARIIPERRNLHQELRLLQYQAMRQFLEVTGERDRDTLIARRLPGAATCRNCPRTYSRTAGSR